VNIGELLEWHRSEGNEIVKLIEEDLKAKAE